jgi:hypothetical protein
MNAISAARRGVARHPVLAFMLISLGIGFATAAIPPIVDSEIPPFGQRFLGVVGVSLGVGLAAFLVTAALSVRDGVADLERRSVRWWVPVRWYLIALLERSCNGTYLMTLRLPDPLPIHHPLLGLVYTAPKSKICNASDRRHLRPDVPPSHSRIRCWTHLMHAWT